MSEQATHLRRVRMKVEPHVYAWCYLRSPSIRDAAGRVTGGDGREFNKRELFAYVHQRSAATGDTCDDDSVRKCMNVLRNAEVIDYVNTDKRRGMCRVTAARGLDYVPTQEPAEQLEIGVWK